MRNKIYTFQTFNDTKSAIKQISEIIGNNIAPDSATQSTKTTASLTVPDSTSAGTNTTAVNATETTTSSPTSTTRAPYVLTRSTLQTIIRRNVLGLVRLFNIEWKDALNVRSFDYYPASLVIIKIASFRFFSNQIVQ